MICACGLSWFFTVNLSKIVKDVCMKIAVCDDDEIITQQTAQLLNEYLDHRRFVFEYDIFTSYEELADKIDDYTLFFLDYNMNDSNISPNEPDRMNGMDFARLLRSKSKPTKGIIFLTSYSDFIYEAFEVRTYRFLTKPIVKEKLFKVLDDFFSTPIDSGKIMIKGKSSSRLIDIDSIYYIDVVIKDIYIHLENETIKCRGKIETFEKDLEAFGFFRTHRAYLVNLSKINSLTSKSAEMANGDSIYVSSKKYAELCEAFLKRK